MDLPKPQLHDPEFVRARLSDDAQVLLDHALALGCTAELDVWCRGAHGPTVVELAVFGTPALPRELLLAL